MASLIPSAGASGTGSLTLQGPNTNSNQTVTIPDATGTVMVSGNMPAFSAYPNSNQSITTSTFTKILFQTTEFDTTSGMYASSRFTPTIAGYYQVQVSVAPNTATTYTQAAIYKNGSLLKRVIMPTSNGSAEVTALVYFNGSTDYVEGYGYLTGITPALQGSSDQTYFQAVLVRAA